MQHVDPLDLVFKLIPLLLISPNHGNVCYQWEKKETLEWEAIDVPNNTCVLYVKSCGMYKCTVDGEVYSFEVQGWWLNL